MVPRIELRFFIETEFFYFRRRKYIELKNDKSIYKVGIYALLGSAVLTFVSQVWDYIKPFDLHLVSETGIEKRKAFYGWS